MATHTLVESIQNSIISDGVLSSLSPTAIHRVSLTCRSANDAVRSYCRRAWNINNLLSKFFPNPHAFRSLQARTGAIICGSFALQFFARTRFPDEDLEVCVPSSHFLEVGQWFLESANVGYRFQPSKSQDPCFEENAKIIKEGVVENNEGLPLAGVAATFTFVRENSDLPIKIHMKIAESSVFKILFNSSSTCMMNFITFDKACSLYPRNSFVVFKSLITAHGEGEHMSVIRQCEERGWKMDTEATTMCSCSRWVGDNFCWTMPLSLEGVIHPDISQTPPIELNGWSLAPTRRDHMRSWLNKDWKARCIVLRSPELKFTYAFPDTPFWADFIAQWRPSSFNDEIAQGDAYVRTHVEFCRRFSNNIDATIEDEQRNHHATLVDYFARLRKIEARVEESEEKLKRADGLVQVVHDMEVKVTEFTTKINDIALAVKEWAKSGPDPASIENLLRVFETVEE